MGTMIRLLNAVADNDGRKYFQFPIQGCRGRSSSLKHVSAQIFRVIFLVTESR